MPKMTKEKLIAMLENSDIIDVEIKKIQIGPKDEPNYFARSESKYNGPKWGNQIGVLVLFDTENGDG